MAQYAPQYNLFAIIGKIRIIRNLIFWIVFILSTLPFVLNISGVVLDMEDVLNTINIICIAMFFMMEYLIDEILTPQADSRRRDSFLDNAFGSKFTTSPSIGYFDTDEVDEGLYKAACNLFENCFFTYSLSKALTIRKLVIPSIVLISVAVCAYFGFKQAPFALSLLEALFSTSILGGLIKHCVLLAKLHDIQDSWITLFQHTDLKSNLKGYEAVIYRHWLQYEALHSRIQAEIPDKLFSKMNSELTREWIGIKQRYSIV
jgi:hypothetical protein